MIVYCVSMTQDGVSGEDVEAAETVGQRVAKYRKMEGLSAQKLAEEAGLTRSIVANIENGRRDDLTVRELLSISEALRVPPAALLFDVTRPTSPAPGGGEADLLRPRVIDLVDWLSASDDESDPQLAEFFGKLEEMDGVVLYPVGLTITATYGKAGRHARALVNAGRTLKQAMDRYAKTHRDVLIVARQVWAYGVAESDQLEDAMQAGILSGSSIGESLIEALPASDEVMARALMREVDAAARNLRDARTQLTLLGGRAEGMALGLGPREIMTMVQSMPHEPIATTTKRGKLSDAIVESPFREYADDRLKHLRARFARENAAGSTEGVDHRGIDQEAP